MSIYCLEEEGQHYSDMQHPNYHLIYKGSNSWRAQQEGPYTTGRGVSNLSFSGHLQTHLHSGWNKQQEIIVYVFIHNTPCPCSQCSCMYLSMKAAYHCEGQKHKWLTSTSCWKLSTSILLSSQRLLYRAAMLFYFLWGRQEHLNGRPPQWPSTVCISPGHSFHNQPVIIW